MNVLCLCQRWSASMRNLCPHCNGTGVMAHKDRDALLRRLGKARQDRDAQTEGKG